MKASESLNAPLSMQHHMPRQLADGYHVRRLLQLNRLLIDETASIMQDHVWVEGAIFRLAFLSRTAWSSVSDVGILA